MGLKKTNYYVKDMRYTLPEAYAYIRETRVNGNTGYAIIAVHESRALAADPKVIPFEQVVVNFTVDREANDRVTAYMTAKATKEITKRIDGELQTVILPGPFTDWEDDIVEILPETESTEIYPEFFLPELQEGDSVEHTDIPIEENNL